VSDTEGSGAALSPLSGSLGPFRDAGLGVVLNWLGSSKVPSDHEMENIGPEWSSFGW